MANKKKTWIKPEVRSAKIADLTLNYGVGYGPGGIPGNPRKGPHHPS